MRYLEKIRAFFSFKSPDSGASLSRQDNYLARDILLKEAESPSYLRNTVRTVVAFLVVFVVWALFSKVDIVTNASGQILPGASVQIVQHLDGGRIAAIKVEDGQAVKRGSVLVALNDEEVRADLETSRARYWALYARVERLRAFVEGRAPRFGAIPKKFRRFARDEQTILSVARSAKSDQAGLVQAQLQQVSGELQAVEELVAIRSDLAKDRLVSRTSVLENQRSLEQLRGQQSSLKQQLALNASERTSFAADEMGKAEAELSQLDEQVKKLEDRFARTQLVAPMDGIVQGLVYKTVGGVIAPGAEVLKIVPQGGRLEAEMQISASEVGYVRIGQPVRLKVATYDFLRYGTLNGKVSMVSATSTTNAAGQTSYQVKVLLHQMQLGNKPGVRPLQSGMVVNADIITDRQSVMRYLLRPVFAAFAKSFSER